MSRIALSPKRFVKTENGFYLDTEDPETIVFSEGDNLIIQWKTEMYSDNYPGKKTIICQDLIVEFADSMEELENESTN